MKSAFLVAAAALFSYSPAAFSQQRLATRTIRRPVPAATSVAGSVPMWTGTDGTFSYTMVGQSPVTKLASPTTTINVEILPIALVFSDGTTLDPTVVDKTCSPAGSALSLVEQSPLFNNFVYTVGGTAVGTTEYHDFFQRANFWKYASPTGVNPNYHVMLSASPHAVTTITVPAADGSTIAGACGRIGQVSLPWFDTYIQNNVFPAQGVVPTQLGVVLLYNTAIYEPSEPNALILGYHSAFSNTATAGALQTYLVGHFDTTGSFGTIEDVADLSHEMGEWMDDPLGNNPTPSWGHIGEVTGCEATLEVGDPLSGTDIPITMSNAYVYHLQELAFASWYFHDSPSTGVNGWFSSNGTFKTSAPACSAVVLTATSTALTLSSTTVTAGTSVTATVTVKAATGSPAGTVSLVSSTGVTLGMLTVASGKASGSVVLPAGSYTVTAEYGGSSTFAASNSTAVSVLATAPPVATTTTLSLSSTSVAAGTSVTATVVVKAASGTPTGTVTLVTSTGTTLATLTLVSGAASGSVVLAAGSYTVTAKYAGSAAFTASNSTAVSVVSTLRPTTTTFALSASTATIAVKPTSGSGTPSGTVALVSSTGTKIATVTLTSGAFTGAVTLAAGSYTVTAEYSGDTTFAASNSTALSVTSGPVLTLSPTSLTFASTAVGKSAANQTITVTNKGTASQTSLTVTDSGADATDFTLTNTCASTLAVNASCSVVVTFKPVATGTRTATLKIASSSVVLTGTATAAVTSKGKT